MKITTKAMKELSILIAAVSLMSLLFAACGSNTGGQGNSEIDSAKPTQSISSTPVPTATTTPVKIDFSKVKPDESGKVMVVMFHNFVQAFKPTQYDDGQYTTTFDKFRSLLKVLYNKGYRLVSLKDFLDNNISVPAGFIPMVFTFDDGSSGQFNLVYEDGKLVVNKNSAVAIMEEFYKEHPDFGLQGTFYVNLGGGTFEGKGKLSERLKYLIDKGFEVGNHTKTHIDLGQVSSADKVRLEVGGNQKVMYDFVPGYKMNSLALPLGNTTSSNLRGLVAKGVYKGIAYNNLAIMEVGWNPTLTPVNKGYNPLLTHRVRATGIKAVDMDLNWWLKNLSRSGQYISDGNLETISVPKSKSSSVVRSKLNGKKLNLY